MVIGICFRCKRDCRFDDVKNKLCRSCYVSIRDHKKRLDGTISEKYREIQNKNSREYYKKNKEYFKEYSKNYYYKDKLKRLSRDRTDKNAALKKFNYKCKECNHKKNLEVHHKKYVNFTVNDLIVLCRDCHRKLHRLSNVIN